MIFQERTDLNLIEYRYSIYEVNFTIKIARYEQVLLFLR